MVYNKNGSRKRDLSDGLLIDMTEIGSSFGIAVSSAITIDLWDEYQRPYVAVKDPEFVRKAIALAFTEAMKSFGNLPKGVEITSFDFQVTKPTGDLMSVKVLVDIDEDGEKCLTFMLPDELLIA